MTPCSRTWSLQNCEEIHSCCLSPSGLCILWWQPWGLWHCPSACASSSCVPSMYGCFSKIISQNSCCLASLALISYHRLFDTIMSPPPACGTSPKHPRNSRLVSEAPIWLAHFASFWVVADYHKARLAKGQKSIRRETAGTTGVGFTNLATQCAGFVELHGTGPYAVNFSSAHKLHFAAILEGWVTDAARGRCVHKSCYQIIGLPCLPPVRLWKFTPNSTYTATGQPFFVQQIKSLPNHF